MPARRCRRCRPRRARRRRPVSRIQPAPPRMNQADLPLSREKSRAAPPSTAKRVSGSLIAVVGDPSSKSSGSPVSKSARVQLPRRFEPQCAALRPNAEMRFEPEPGVASSLSVAERRPARLAGLFAMNSAIERSKRRRPDHEAADGELDRTFRRAAAAGPGRRLRDARNEHRDQRQTPRRQVARPKPRALTSPRTLISMAPLVPPAGTATSFVSKYAGRKLMRTSCPRRRSCRCRRRRAARRGRRRHRARGRR